MKYFERSINRFDKSLAIIVLRRTKAKRRCKCKYVARKVDKNDVNVTFKYRINAVFYVNRYLVLLFNSVEYRESINVSNNTHNLQCVNTTRQFLYLKTCHFFSFIQGLFGLQLVISKTLSAFRGILFG